MTDDLVLWLRNEAAAWTNLTPRQDEMLRAAADRIEALESDNEKKREVNVALFDEVVTNRARIEALERQVAELAAVGDAAVKALHRALEAK